MKCCFYIGCVEFTVPLCLFGILLLAQFIFQLVVSSSEQPQTSSVLSEDTVTMCAPYTVPPVPCSCLRRPLAGHTNRDNKLNAPLALSLHLFSVKSSWHCTYTLAFLLASFFLFCFFQLLFDRSVTHSSEENICKDVLEIRYSSDRLMFQAFLSCALNSPVIFRDSRSVFNMLA